MGVLASSRPSFPHIIFPKTGNHSQNSLTISQEPERVQIQQTSDNMGSNDPNAAPAGAKDAVLVKSGAMPEGAVKVEDFDFNNFKGPMSAEDLLLGMRHMGFQASSIGEAVRIINEMVSI